MPTNVPQLCQNVNQVQTPAGGVNGFPINTGNFNRRKVALDSDLTRVYEIQCLTSGLSFAGATGAFGGYSFETCIKYCNDNPTTCQWGVVFSNSTAGPFLGSCQFATGYLASNPPPLKVGNAIGSQQRVAKLLNPSTFPLVNDAVFFQSKISPDGNLGFCTGPNTNNFNMTFIALQYNDGSYSGNTDQIHQLSCGRLGWFGTGGSNIDASLAATAIGVPYPQTPEDCARLCNYNYRAAVAPRCQAWQMTDSAICQMYSERIGGAAPSPTYIATVTAAGVRIGGVTQTNVAAYKRDLEFDPNLGPAMPQPIGRYHRRVAYDGDSFQELKPDHIIQGM